MVALRARSFFFCLLPFYFCLARAAGAGARRQAAQPPRPSGDVGLRAGRARLPRALRVALLARTAKALARGGGGARRAALGVLGLRGRLAGALRRARLAAAPAGARALLGAHEAARDTDARRRAAHRAGPPSHRVPVGAAFELGACCGSVGARVMVSEVLARSDEPFRGVGDSRRGAVGVARATSVSGDD